MSAKASTPEDLAAAEAMLRATSYYWPWDSPEAAVRSLREIASLDRQMIHDLRAALSKAREDGIRIARTACGCERCVARLEERR